MQEEIIYIVPIIEFEQVRPSGIGCCVSVCQAQVCRFGNGAHQRSFFYYHLILSFLADTGFRITLVWQFEQFAYILLPAYNHSWPQRLQITQSPVFCLVTVWKPVILHSQVFNLRSCWSITILKGFLYRIRTFWPSIVIFFHRAHFLYK